MRYEPEHCEFDFYFLEQYKISHNKVAKFSQDNYNQFLKQCKDDNGKLHMSSEKNAEWLLRMYSATKMIMSATLLLNSADYAIQKNLMISVPYLLYYAAFSVCRAFLYVSPFEATKDLDNLIKVNHSKVLEVVPDIIKYHFDKEIGMKIKEQLYYLRGQRELFSYKFPASGIRDEIRYDETVDLCGILAELAELASRQVQKIFEKKFLSMVDGSWMETDASVIERLYIYSSGDSVDGGHIEWIDWEDWYRVDYVNRKVKYPMSIRFMMTEGMTEDFFGVWAEDENVGDHFDPDKDWQVIFPIP